MEKKTGRKVAAKPGEDRKQRLKAALKANLARRKAQARGRDGAAGKSRQDSDG